MDVIGVVGLGISAFVATNIDDLFLLVVFLASAKNSFSPRQIFIGQFIGSGTLTAIGLAGSLFALVVPGYVVGLLGFAPIGIGTRKLLALRNGKAGQPPKQALNRSNRAELSSIIAMTAVTISNGGDNISVYVPLFASNNTLADIVVLVAVFMAMTAVWCAFGYYLVNHSFLASRIRRFGRVVLPFVLIGIGIYILVTGFIIPSS
jgi:cadmium resistance protein CadD (predicted permease)